MESHHTAGCGAAHGELPRRNFGTCTLRGQRTHALMCLLGVPSPGDWPVSQAEEAQMSVGLAPACVASAFYGELEAVL